MVYFDRLWKSQGFLDALWGDYIQVQDVIHLISVARVFRNSAQVWSSTINFAASRKRIRFHNLVLEREPLSLNAWLHLINVCDSAFQGVFCSRTEDILTAEIARVSWTQQLCKDGDVCNIEHLPVQAVTPLIRSTYTSLSRMAYRACQIYDVESQRELPETEWCRSGVVLAVKATFAFLDKWPEVPEFALVSILRLDGGKFAFIRMLRPYCVMLSKSLPKLCAEIQRRFGNAIWMMDELSQLAWVRAMPAIWIKHDDLLFQQLCTVRGIYGDSVLREAPDGSLLTYPEFMEKYQEGTRSIWASAHKLVGTCGWAASVKDVLQSQACKSTDATSESDLRSIAIDSNTDHVKGTEASVVEDIHHDEPPAVLDQEEAERISSQRWAGMVERLASNNVSHEFVDSALDFASLAASSFGDASSAQHTTQSAPAPVRSPQCLLPGTSILTAQSYLKHVENVETNDELLCLRTEAKVAAVRRFPSVERDLVRITFKSCDESMHDAEDIVVTASHILPLWRKCNNCSVRACDVGVGDRLRAMKATAAVTHVEQFVMSTAVIEIEMSDRSSTMLISTARPPVTFVEVFGATSPEIENNHAKILHFNRFDGFREALLESDELESCRKALEVAGFTADLSVYELGPGKMLVAPGLAESVLQALNDRNSPPLRCTDVVVSIDFEEVVKRVVQLNTKRAIFVQHEEVLQLPRKAAMQTVAVKRTFVEFQASSSDVTMVTHSTTDTASRKGKNPRLCIGSAIGVKD